VSISEIRSFKSTTTEEKVKQQAKQEVQEEEIKVLLFL